MQVDELKGTFGGLKLDVEAMFMQMPSVDLDELGGQLEAMQHHQEARCRLSPSLLVRVSTVCAALSVWGHCCAPVSELTGVGVAALWPIFLNRPGYTRLDLAVPWVHQVEACCALCTPG